MMVCSMTIEDVISLYFPIAALLLILADLARVTMHVLTHCGIENE